jgi:hypothetical protein
MVYMGQRDESPARFASECHSKALQGNEEEPLAMARNLAFEWAYRISSSEIVLISNAHCKGALTQFVPSFSQDSPPIAKVTLCSGLNRRYSVRPRSNSIELTQSAM